MVLPRAGFLRYCKQTGCVSCIVVRDRRLLLSGWVVCNKVGWFAMLGYMAHVVWLGCVKR